MPAQRKCLIFFITTTIFLFSPKLVFAQNLLRNPGFEEGASGWSKNGGSLDIDNTVYRSGAASARFTNTTTTAHFIKQSVDLDPGKQYKLEAFVKGGEVKDARVWLRVKGGDLDVTSSPISLPGNFTSLSISQFDVPDNVTGVEIRAYLDPEVLQEIIAYFDDFNFEEVIEEFSSPTPLPTPTSLPEATNMPTSTSTPTSFSNIFISEFLADPESGNEKVEIGNGNSFSVSLIDWQIDDIADGGKNPNKFSATISAGGLYVIELDSGTLNNDGDDVRLLDFAGVEKDKRSYSSSTKGKSWSKDKNGNWCQTEPSFSQANPDCSLTVSSTLSPTTVPTKTPTPTKKPTSDKANTPTTKQAQSSLEKEASPSSDILGEEATSSFEMMKFPGSTESGSYQATPSGSRRKLAGIFLSLGGLLILGSGAFLFKKKCLLKGMIKLP